MKIVHNFKQEFVNNPYKSPSTTNKKRKLNTNVLGVTYFKVGYQYTYKWKIIQEMSNSYSVIDENIKNNKINNQYYIIEGLANIIIGENCDMRLSLHQVEESEQIQINANFSHHLNYPIKFCLQNGKLLSFEYLWNDEIFFINLKKALLIQLQMSTQVYKEQFYTIEKEMDTCVVNWIFLELTVE
ncbi:hypothetical protein KSF78_0004151 [Schistosoma japonicum]|nr:hypothetical protein KSF78_0004151 [Schistosoma japonicum]